MITDQAILQHEIRTADIGLLTAGLARGDEAAYRQFFGLYFDRLLRYLLVVTRDEHSAREALQLTLLRVVKHVKGFDSEDAFWKWLTVLARSSVVDEQRKAGRYLSFLTRFFHEKMVEEPAAETETQTHLVQLLEANLAALPEEERELIQKKYFAGELVREIAREADCTEKAVESRLVRARRKLKEAILAQLKHGR